MDMKSSYQGDPGIAGRYLADQLSPEEQAGYEEYLRSHPQAVRELEATARLKVGLEKLRETGELDRLLPLTRPVRTKRWFQGPPLLALAASIAVLCVGVMLWYTTTQPLASLTATLAGLQRSTNRPLTMGGRLVIMRTRAAGDDAVIVLPPTEQALELRVLPDVPAEPDGFRVELSRISDDDKLNLIARGEPIHAGVGGYVEIYADAGLLSVGKYQLALIPIQNADEASSSQLFRIRVQPASSGSAR